jgi:hypothetical protein
MSLYLAVLCTVFILLSGPVQGQASFFQPPTFTNCSPASFASLFVADLNGDGKPDLLCSDGTLSLGNPDGTFKAGAPFPGVVLAVADFNGEEG